MLENFSYIVWPRQQLPALATATQDDRSSYSSLLDIDITLQNLAPVFLVVSNFSESPQFIGVADIRFEACILDILYPHTIFLLHHIHDLGAQRISGSLF